MIRFRKYFGLPFFMMLLVCASLAGCKVGEDDPFLSFRSRDARLKANWKLIEMVNHYEIRTIIAGQQPEVTVIHSDFNGYNLHARTSVNGIIVSDSTFGFNHLLRIKDHGDVTYESTIVQNFIGIKSSGTDNWYWLDTDKKKARVFLGSALKLPAIAGIPQLSGSNLLFLATLFSDFTVDGLRNKELELSYTKTMEQVTLGGFQQITVTSKMTFDSH